MAPGTVPVPGRAHRSVHSHTLTHTTTHTTMPVVFNQTAPAGMRVPPHVRLFHGATLERLTDADFLDNPHCVLRLRDGRVTGEGLTRLSMFHPGGVRPADRGYNVLAPIRVPLR